MTPLEAVALVLIVILFIATIRGAARFGLIHVPSSDPPPDDDPPCAGCQAGAKRFTHQELLESPFNLDPREGKGLFVLPPGWSQCVDEDDVWHWWGPGTAEEAHRE